MNLRSAALIVLCFVSFHLARADDHPLGLRVEEGAYGMINRPWPDGLNPAPVTLVMTWKNATAAQVKLSARNIFDRPISWTQTVSFAASGNRPSSQKISFPGHLGFFRITAETEGAGPGISQTLELGIVPPPHPGFRPDSFFASNTSELKSGTDLAFLQAIGLKVERSHFNPEVTLTEAEWKQPSTGKALPLNFEKLDKLWSDTKAAGIWGFPVAAYGFNPAYGRTSLALALGMWGPPRNTGEFVSTWEEILRHYPELTTYEFWNEPWIFGWTWAGTPEDYRELQKAWCEMALRVNPKMRIVAGNSSMFVRDNIAPYPDSWKGLLQGTSHHPYGQSGSETSYRSGENLRAIDSGMEATREMGLPYYYLTEGGTCYAPEPSPERAVLEKRQAEILAIRRGLNTPEQLHSPEAAALAKENAAITARLAKMPEPSDNPENAAKIVEYYVNAQLDGAFMGNAQWEIGYGPRWTRSNTSFAVMTHLLEDRPVVADIWPEQQLISGAIFAAPKWITPEVKSLPRAAELSARWMVPIPAGRADDATKVAVVWGLTGSTADTLDTQGRLVLDRADGIRAFDLTGREIPARDSTLTIPFGSNPVYFTTEKLGIIEFRNRIAHARLENLVPVNAYALSLARPVTEPQSLSVRLQNQINRDLSGMLALKIPGTGQTVSAPFSVAAGKLTEVPVAWPGISSTPSNEYAIELSARIDGDTSFNVFSRRQLLAEACFVPRTITVDGSLKDWQGVTPVQIDSAMLTTGVDPSKYLLNPGVYQHNDAKTGSHITARVYTAYDKDNIYLAVDVNEPGLRCTVGEPVVKGRLARKVTLPYREGMPDGLNHVTMCGDVFEFAFGFRDRVPQIGRQMNDPYAWKGNFFDTDYCYAANVSTGGDQLTRLYGADTSRENGYQTEAVPGIGPVQGAKIKITRDEAKKETIYEMAIPRAEIPLFHPEDKRLRFGFILYNDEKLGTNNGLSWSETAGVFDYWKTYGSFPPSWTLTLPCQTFFGIQSP